MKRPLIVTFLVLLAAPAFADHHKSMEECSRPDANVSVPDGATASRDEMLDAKDGVQSFVNRGELYVECVEKQISALQTKIQAAMAAEGEEKSDARKMAESQYRELVKMHDEIVVEMQEVAGEFNQALQDYNSQSE